MNARTASALSPASSDASTAVTGQHNKCCMQSQRRATCRLFLAYPSRKMQKIVVLASSAAVVGLTPAVGNLTLNAELNLKKLFRRPLGRSVRTNNTKAVRQEAVRPKETALADGDVKTTVIGQAGEQLDETEKRAFIGKGRQEVPGTEKKAAPEALPERVGYSVSDHTSAVSRRPTSQSKASYVAKFGTTPSEGDLKQQCQGTFQTQKNPTVFKQSSRLASVSQGSDVGQPMRKQEKEPVADELKKTSVKTVERSIETTETQSTINHLQERISPKAKTEPLVCARPMPRLFYPGDLPSEKYFIHRQSQLLAKGTNWAVRQGKIDKTDVYIRWYELEGQNADALWETICRNTHNRAAYGYIYEDCLCAVFDSQVDVSVNADGRELKFHNEIFAYFDVNGWEAGSALVLQATDCHGHNCAVKVLRNRYFFQGIEHECRVMKALASLPFVPRIYGVIVRGEGHSDERHYMISEWVHGHRLDYTDACHDRKHDHKRCGRILQALLQQISAMHKSGYAHRDIKPENIMIGKDGNIRVIDFECASPQFVKSKRGTPGFVAPEVLFKERGDYVDAFAADVYSIAMTWHDIFFGESYIIDEEYKGAYDIAALEMPGTVPELDAAMEDLFCGMACPDPEERISIDQALGHKYFEMLADIQKREN